MTQVSIIIPIYNTELYLRDALDSIVAQTFENWEVILVNDGSTDKSSEICEEYVKKDSRFKYIYKENEGVTIARKIGVECASGEWIYFVDSDDILPSDSISTLILYAKADVDIVIGTIKNFGAYKTPSYCYEKLNALQYIKSLLKVKIHSGPVARLIRKIFFDNFVFDIPANIIVGEDLIMNLRLGQKISKVILLPDIVYHYIYRPGSAMTKKPHLNKGYRIAFDHTIRQSINIKHQKFLRKEIIYYYFLRRWWFLKSFIKNIALGRRAI